MQPTTELFDSYADDYSAALAEGLRLSGESQDFFSRGRIDLLASEVERLGRRADRVLDFGCGQGASAPLLKAALKARLVLGVDVSSALVEGARKQFTAPGIAFQTLAETEPAAAFDCVYCNGVFHHIPLEERAEAVSYIYKSLSSGGIFGLWENNPLNPGTRLVMRRIPFDRDAKMLSIGETKHLLAGAGFRVAVTRSAFFFPRILRALRSLESVLSNTWLGAQYLVIGIKP